MCLNKPSFLTLLLLLATVTTFWNLVCGGFVGCGLGRRHTSIVVLRAVAAAAPGAFHECAVVGEGAVVDVTSALGEHRTLLGVEVVEARTFRVGDHLWGACGKGVHKDAHVAHI